MTSLALLRQLGVTLIELMIGMAILAALLMLAAPSFSTAIQNGQVRTTAESVISGLQTARAEAVRRNRLVRLSLPQASGGTDWTIHADDQSGSTPSYTIPVQARSGAEAGAVTRIGVNSGSNFSTPAAAGAGMPATIVFNGMGRLSSATSVRRLDVTHSGNTGARWLSILLTPGGDVRLCNPALSLASNPQGCA